MRYFFLFLFAYSVSILGITPQKIISISPASTEILFALDLGKQVVGVTTACNYPSQVNNVTKVGGFLSPNAEKIIALSPELVIGIGDELTIPLTQLKSLDLHLKIYPSPHSIADIFQIIKDMGKTLGKDHEATLLINKLKKSMVPVKSSQLSQPKPSVVVLLWASPFIAVGEHTFISDLIEKAGGKNRIHSALEYPKITPETLLKADPDYLILTDPSFLPVIEKSSQLASLKAVRLHHIITSIHADCFLRPGPRFPIALQELRQIFAQ